MKPLILALALGLILACAGRGARLVMIQQPFDQEMSCEQLRASIRENQGLVQSKYREIDRVKQNNADDFKRGPITLFTSWFSLDFKTERAARKEIKNLRQRIRYQQTAYYDGGCSDS